MERVFISYSRNNLDVVQELIQDLKAVGIDAWYDKTLTGGAALVGQDSVQHP